jgi:ubiquinone/menaquinone biosynthesis C-methylase UbiE
MLRRMAVTGWLDRVLFRSPFEGGSARRYAALERPAFGDLDDRILDGWPELASAKRLLDLGAGPGTFAARAAARHRHLTVVAVEPSRDLSRAQPGIHVVRATGEALPLPDGACDAAICLSSVRHVKDRAQTLRELRRVITGKLLIVELDPAASSARIATHAARIASPLLRAAFGPLVVRTAPTSKAIEAIARDAGWSVRSRRDDEVQPVYILDLA